MQNFGIVLIILLALSAVILLVYVLSKLSELEAIAGNIISSRNQTEGQSATASEQSIFSGLQGQALWQAMTGDSRDTVLSRADEILTYQIILQKHLRKVALMGFQDGLNGSSARPPQSEMMISMLRGDILSWLPASTLAQLYTSSYDAANAMPNEVKPLAEQVTYTITSVYNSVTLDADDFVDEILVLLRLFTAPE
jgi:hypothetical protein